jgi:hypothetical protein
MEPQHEGLHGQGGSCINIRRALIGGIRSSAFGGGQKGAAENNQ